MHSTDNQYTTTYSVPVNVNSTEEMEMEHDHPRSAARRRKRPYYSLLGDKIPARLVLYFLSWSGFLVSFMMRNDINFALVAMTRPADPHESASPASASLPLPLPNNTDNSSITLYMNENVSFTSAAVVENDPNMHKYDWSSTVTSVIVSSFYWWYVLSQVAGGVATQYFGTKSVFGWSQLATALSSLLIPLAADMHYTVVILLRSIQGFASGLTWPAMYAIVGYWIPLTERSRFMSSFQGFSIGIGLTYPLCGFIIDNFGWPYAFYTTGSLGVAWCIVWYLLAYNTPQEHPRITREELDYIELSVSSEVSNTGQKVPWIRIFTSLPAWAIGITTFGRIWVHYIFIVRGPMFMKYILKFEYQTNGFLSGMPFICSYLSSVLFCYIADKMLLHKLLSLTNTRKLFTILSQVIPALLLYWLGYVENIPLLLVIWFVAVIFVTASYAGAMANIVDIAPNFAGQVLAFCQTIHMSASFLSPLVAGLIVTKESSIEQYRTVFTVSSIVAVLTNVFYQIYGTAEVQSWNDTGSANKRLDEQEEERQILKNANDSANAQSIPKP